MPPRPVTNCIASFRRKQRKVAGLDQPCCRRPHWTQSATRSATCPGVAGEGDPPGQPSARVITVILSPAPASAAAPLAAHQPTGTNGRAGELARSRQPDSKCPVGTGRHAPLQGSWFEPRPGTRSWLRGRPAPSHQAGRGGSTVAGAPAIAGVPAQGVSERNAKDPPVLRRVRTSSAAGRATSIMAVPPGLKVRRRLAAAVSMRPTRQRLIAERLTAARSAEGRPPPSSRTPPHSICLDYIRT